MENPGASVQDVANAAGLTRQLVGIYFPGGGTGPIFSALFDDFLASIPTFFEGVMEVVSSRPAAPGGAVDDETMRQSIALVINAFFDWGENDIREPWIFSSGRDRPGSGIGDRWDQMEGAFADALISLRPEFEGSSLVRNAFIIELEGFAKLMERLLSGSIKRDDAFRIAAERFFALYTVVLPSLSD